MTYCVKTQNQEQINPNVLSSFFFRAQVLSTHPTRSIAGMIKFLILKRERMKDKKESPSHTRH